MLVRLKALGVKVRIWSHKLDLMLIVVKLGCRYATILCFISVGMSLRLVCLASPHCDSRTLVCDECRLVSSLRAAIVASKVLIWLLRMLLLFGRVRAPTFSQHRVLLKLLSFFVVLRPGQALIIHASCSDG